MDEKDFEEASFDEVTEFMKKAGASARESLLIDIVYELLRAVEALQVQVSSLSIQIGSQNGSTGKIGVHDRTWTTPQVTWSYDVSSTVNKIAQLKTVSSDGTVDR